MSSSEWLREKSFSLRGFHEEDFKEEEHEEQEHNYAKRNSTQAGFQINASCAAPDWLIFKKRRFDWLKVTSD